VNWKEILSGLVIGSILGIAGSYLIQTNQITALETKLNILEKSSLDFKNTQKLLGEISVKQEALNNKDLELKKLEIELESKSAKIKENELLLKLDNDKYLKLKTTIATEKKNIQLLQNKLSLISRGETYMQEFITNFSDIDRNVKKRCNDEYNQKVRKANSILEAIHSIGIQLEKNNEFSLFYDSQNQSGYSSFVDECDKQKIN
jgi:chromosome segregation ATPase